jgi:hypothetical protein
MVNPVDHGGLEAAVGNVDHYISLYWRLIAGRPSLIKCIHVVLMAACSQAKCLFIK